MAMMWRKLLICARSDLFFDLLPTWSNTALDRSSANYQFALPRDDNANHDHEPDQDQDEERADYLIARKVHQRLRSVKRNTSPTIQPTMSTMAIILAVIARLFLSCATS